MTGLLTGNASGYRLIRSKRRTFELRIYPDKRVEVRVPQRASLHAIECFVESKHAWLEKTLSRMVEQPVLPTERLYEDGERLSYLGCQMHLRVVPGRKRVFLEGDALWLQTPSSSSRAMREKQLEDWLRQQAREEFERLIDRHFPAFAQLGHRRPVLRIKKMKSRWGSLSTRGYINLNLRLMEHSPECIEYVVLHELCHLQHMNHGARFKALLGRHLPDWPERKTQLEKEAGYTR